MKKSFLLYLTLITVIFCSFTNDQFNSVKAIHTNDVDILVIIDEEFGGNCQTIVDKFEQFGWNIKLAGPTETVSGCDYSIEDFEVDFLFSEVNNITSYDCVNIMPGASHVNLLANQDDILGKIDDANTADIIIGAWCRATRVLATADVIDGVNVTGHSDYASEYTAAGATFYSDSPPIISENIVTVSTTQFYLMDMCIALTQAIGCYEADAPTIVDSSVIKFANLSQLLIVVISEESGILSVKAELNLLSSPSESNAPATIFYDLLDPEFDNNFSVLIPNGERGDYSASIEVTDVFENGHTYENMFTLVIGTDEASLEFIPFALSISMIFLITIRQSKKK